MNLAPVLYGLAAAACWGAGVFGGGLAARRASVLASAIVGEASGLTLAVVMVIVVGEPSPSPAGLAWALVAGIVGVAGGLTFLRALAVGSMSVATPLATVIGAAIPVVAGFAFGRPPSSSQAIGAVLALVAITLASMPRRSATRERGVLGLAVFAGVCWGGNYLCTAEAIGSGAGTWWTLIASMAVGFTFTTGAALATHRVTEVRRSASRLMVASGSLNVVGGAFYLLSVGQGSLPIAVILSSQYIVVTALLARLLLGERLASARVAAIGLAVAGVTLMTLP